MLFRSEDYEMYLQLAVKGEFAFDAEPLAVWRYHPNNTGHDSAMMAREITNALARQQVALGLTDAELKHVQQNVRFTYARAMLQAGDKLAAARAGFANSNGARSVGELTRFAIRLMVPMSVIEARRAARAHEPVLTLDQVLQR